MKLIKRIVTATMLVIATTAGALQVTAPARNRAADYCTKGGPAFCWEDSLSALVRKGRNSR